MISTGGGGAICDFQCACVFTHENTHRAKKKEKKRKAQKFWGKEDNKAHLFTSNGAVGSLDSNHIPLVSPGEGLLGLSHPSPNGSLRNLFSLRSNKTK